MNFTAHNILLNDGIKTLGDAQPLLADTALWASIKKTLDLFIPINKQEAGNLKVVDFGCLEGGYTVEFARLGFNVVGIEARQDNIDKCDYVKSNLNLTNLTFIKDDVRNVQNYGKFDIALCYGLLYHLNNPVEFLKILNSCTSKILILHTHYAPEHDIRYNFNTLNRHFFQRMEGKFPSVLKTKNYFLSKISENEGYKGRWFYEYQENEETKKIEKMLWASYNNNKSFWLLKEQLTKVLHNVGFTSVFEQFDDGFDANVRNYNYYYNRSMFVAIKH